MSPTHDIVIVGGGSAGLTGARFAARLGASVALVEKHRIGGDCTWTGCVPSKALIRAAKSAHEARTAARFGVDVPAPVIDMKRVRDHVRASIETVYEAERPEVLAEEGIEVVATPAQFVDSHSIGAGDRTLVARQFVVCTGARPAIPPIPGLADVTHHTHETVFDNDRLPEHLLVIGAGPIGAEIAQAYRRLGASVSLMAQEMLPGTDPEVRDSVAATLEDEGIGILLGDIDEVSMNGAEYVVRCPGGVARGDMLLVATGRRPNVDGLALDKAGVDHGRHGIPVDRYLRSNVGHIYAAGDVLGGPQFTHLAGWQCFQAVRNALLPGRDAGMPAVLPHVTFLDPEVAGVGLSEAEARNEHGADVRVHRWTMQESDRAVADGHTSGFIKIVATAGGGVLGASIIAARAGEMIGEFALAMDQGIGLSELSRTVHAYPTWTTAIQQVASAEAVDRFLASRVGRIARRMSGI